MPQRVVPDAPARTFSLRRGRLGPAQAELLDRLWPRWGVDVDGRPLDLPALFGRTAPVVLDVGCGMGEATATAAAADPDRDVLAVDVHTPGHAALLRRLEAAGTTWVRVADGDVRVLLADMLPPAPGASAGLDEVRVWFPDPWPKARHAKRRLVTPGFLALAASRLRPGGRLHVATDSPPYAEQVVAALAASDELHLVSCDRPGERPVTRFEQRALDAGRQVRDLVAVRARLSPASGAARASARPRT